MNYRDRERAALREIALATFADQRAPKEDRLAARARLVTDDRELGIDHLDGAEASLLDLLIRRAMGEARDPILDAVIAVYSELVAREHADREAREAAARAATTPAPRPAPRIAVAERVEPRPSGPTPPPAGASPEDWKDFARRLVESAR